MKKILIILIFALSLTSLIFAEDNINVKSREVGFLPENEQFLKEMQALKEKNKALERECAVQESLLEVQFQATLRQPQSDKSKNREAIQKNLHMQLGYVYASFDRTEEALREYRSALKIDPNNRDLHFNLGYLLARQNLLKEAISEYMKSLKGSSEDQEVYYNLALIYAMDLKKQKEADDYYRKYQAFSNKNQ
ncbi:MAG: tetratricopeptide repeat protein [Candidatus Omnitrophota bacterium]